MLRSKKIKKTVRRTAKKQNKKSISKATTEDMLKLFKNKTTNIRVVGTGGAGGNTLSRMAEVGIEGVETIAINTDAQDLLATPADKKILIGKQLTRGLGAGSDPAIGEAAAEEDISDIKEALRGSDLVFVTCGLGGGTGTGSAPIIAKVAKDMKALTVAVVTLPFTAEGYQRMENAIKGLSALQKVTDTIIVVPNDKILELAPELPMNAAFKVSDEILTDSVKGIAEAINKPALINVDFADVRTIMSKGGAAMVGIGESKTNEAGERRALEAAEAALTSSLLDVDISGATRALVNVVGGADMTLREAELIVETVSNKISPQAHIIWGAMIDENLPRNKITAMVVVVGGKFPFLQNLGKGDLSPEDFDLDIDFTD